MKADVRCPKCNTNSANVEVPDSIPYCPKCGAPITPDNVIATREFHNGQADLIAFLTSETAAAESEETYMQEGPGKNGQDGMTGVQCVAMNIELLESLLECDNDELYDIWCELTPVEQRAVWEKSHFHWGIMGYDEDDADHWWSKKKHS